jgi:hypothetical protein
MFLPTIEDDKKKGAVVLMLTPNYNSSRRIMNYPLFVNKLRYSSYYLEKNVSYYINGANLKDVEEDEVEESRSIDDIISSPEYQAFTEMTAAERNALPDSAFGLPKQRKYPLDTEEHVKSAIKFFNYCKKEDEEELAKNINKAIKKFDMDVNVGKNNRFYNYYTENTIETSEFLRYVDESVYMNLDDKVLFFGEDGTNDTQIRKLLYKQRLRKRQEVLELYDTVKKDNPFIKYTFTDINKYNRKNLFVDLYYYNSVFFQNNKWTMKKGLSLYYDFMNRLINNPVINNAGYSKKTIIIPVNDWDFNHDATVWNYKSSINPLSIMYQLMFSGGINKLKSVFGDTNIIFAGNNRYFKMNFSEIEDKDVRYTMNKFKMFLIKICKNENFDAEDIDTSSENKETPEVIKANVIDKIELAKGVDLTARVARATQLRKKDPRNVAVAVTTNTTTNTQPAKKKSVSSTNKPVTPAKNEESDKVISKATLNKQETDKDKGKESKLDSLASAIDINSDNSKSEDDFYDKLDDDKYIKSIIMDLDSLSDDGVDISVARSNRMKELNSQFMDSSINGKTVKDILSENPVKDQKPVALPISTPNKEDWSNLTFMNFDKDYNIDADILSIFNFFSTTSNPMAVRKVDATDASTTEDRIMKYVVEMEDFRGKRFTIKLDIPIMVDNRFLLRGDNKAVQTQFFNMPIIKVSSDTCQIISNYMKIIVSRFGSGAGKSLPITSRFIKAANKYTGRAIKFTTWDNSRISLKYSLPVDYIDLSGSFATIETDDFIVYFNQDEIRKLYDIDEKKGIPYIYYKKDKNIGYIDYNCLSFTQILINEFEKFGGEKGKYNEFLNLIAAASRPASCMYSKCDIMSSKIPLVVICAYHEGLRTTLDKADIKYEMVTRLTKEIRQDMTRDWIEFDDGYIVFNSTYESSLLLNGLKVCPTNIFSITDIDNKNMYLEFLDNFGGRLKADGLENFYDLMVDPLTKKTLEYYKLPTDYVSILIYANNMLVDSNYIKHTDTSSRRLRRYELIAVYTYKVLADSYAQYTREIKHSRESAEFKVKESAVIDKFLTDSITSDDSCITALHDIEVDSEITTKGPSGMNSDRAYTVDKRTYDDSMLNILGMSTGFSANSGVTRQATMNANVANDGGYVKSINGDTEKFSNSNTLCTTEALTPFGVTHDDPIRSAMTFIQTSKHMVRTEESDPLLVTTGADEAVPFITSDRFAFKAKKDGKVLEMVDGEYIILEYEDGSHDYINLKETIEKNSDGGYYVPLKLDPSKGIRLEGKVKKNQIVAYDKSSFSNSVGESDNISYNMGKLAKVAVINTDEGFEDSGVLREGMAEKLATRINLKFDVVIDKETNLLMYKKVGDKVECQDDLMIWQAPVDDEDSNNLLKTLATSDEISELGKRKLKSEVTGVITDLRIYRTVEIEELSESLQKFVTEYEKPIKAMDKKLTKLGLPTSQLHSHEVLSPTGKLKKSQNAIFVEYYVEYVDTVGVGDKVVYYSANKAVEKALIPDDKAPYTDFRPNEPIDAFVSQVSIDKRMVTSTLILGSIQKALVELDRSVKDILGIKYDDTTV